MRVGLTMLLGPQSTSVQRTEGRHLDPSPRQSKDFDCLGEGWGVAARARRRERGSRGNFE